MLDEHQELALNMVMEGKLKKTEIAKKLHRSRQWLYDAVINNEECVAEMDRRLQEIQLHCERGLKSSLQSHIDNVKLLAVTAESEKVRLDANQYLIDRVLGKTTSKMDLEVAPKQQQVDGEDIWHRYKLDNGGNV